MIDIDFPLNGAVLNHRHGQPVDGGLSIQVTGVAPPGATVKINGQLARREGDRFHGETILDKHECDIHASCRIDDTLDERHIRVVWDRHSVRRYRVAIDDNIFFLCDLVQHEHRSLFDNFYLAHLRDLHQRYGAKFVLNLFYSSDAQYPGPTVTLADVSDRYKGEWRDNADWLKLSFHAYSEKPDRPYQGPGRQYQLAADHDLIQREIIRFAGEASWSEPTIVHWAMADAEGIAELRARNVKVLSGLFMRKPDGGFDISFGMDAEFCEQVSRYGLMKHHPTDMTFSKVDCVVNSTPIERIVPMLSAVVADPNRGETLDLFTHEQYYWPFYKRHLPDHMQRMETAVRFCTEQGYKPVFFHEGFLGVPM